MSERQKPIRDIVMVDADGGLFEDSNGLFITLSKFSNGALPYDIYGRYKVTLYPLPVVKLREPEPKPCPFCGGTQISTELFNSGWTAGCSECGTSTPYKGTRAGAIAAWNRRA
jgi:Lar family restriction alleviation protein